MLEVLFNSDFFKSDDIRYEKVKGPAELLTGVLRLTGEFDRPRREIQDRYDQTNFMGQMLTNPPSVEGWRQGVDWIETGTLIERVNFVSEQFGDLTKPGVRDDGRQHHGRVRRPDAERANRPVHRATRLHTPSRTRREMSCSASRKKASTRRDKVAQVLRLAATTHEFQRA